MSDAKDTLLRALERLEEAERDLGTEPTRADLIVIYEIGAKTNNGWESVSGWASTPGPKWMHAALMRRAADANDEAIEAVDDDE